jgi:uncharacterized protein YceH (UPF0502 family)
MELPPLAPAEIRVLGALIEKELTTPEYYPLSLNALVNACNQSNNRDPVVSFGEETVRRAMDGLRDRHLAAVVSGGENRVLKCRHLVHEVLELPRPELGVLCVLLLRGPQTPGELRSRTGRMAEFADLAAVQEVLTTLAARQTPLVAVLPRQPGTKEARWTHLLGGKPDFAAPPESNATASLSPESDRLGQLTADVKELKRELADLRQEFADFRKQLE